MTFDSNYVVKSNHLIEAKYKLSVIEQKLVLFFISKIKESDTEFFKSSISVKEFLEITNIKNNSIYNDLFNTSKSIMSKPIAIKDYNSFLIIGWFSSIEYINGEIVAIFNQELRPYLLQMKEHFTMYQINNIIKLKSVYSIRIYELLKQYEKVGNRIIKIEELRDILKIDDNEYKMYAHLKQRIVLPAKEELLKNSDIFFDFDEIKTGRKVVAINFIITKNSINNIEYFVNDVVEMLKNILQIDIAENLIVNLATQIVQEYKDLDDFLNKIKIRLTSIATKSERPKKLFQYMKKIKNVCDDDFIVARYSISENKTTNSKKAKICNYEGRKWDYELLDKLETEYIQKESQIPTVRK